MSESAEDQRHILWATQVVSAYVSNNAVPASELPNLIGAVHASLAQIAGKPEEPVKPTSAPPVSIRKSITDDYLICLEDGKRFKSLKRHLQTVYGMTPDQYREKWGLNRDYPMVAPAYAKARSALAKEMGLGATRRKIVPELPADELPAEAADEQPVIEVGAVAPAKETKGELPADAMETETKAKPRRRKKADA